MATQQEILREYLISLGFQVNANQHKRWTNAIRGANLDVLGLAKGVVGLMVTTQAFVAIWARSMERLHYSSKLAQSSASNLKALDFGGRSVGIENIQEAVKGIARALRANPGLKGLLESFGIPVTGRDMSDVANDFVGVLKKMPFYKASQYAGLFGIDPDTLLLWQDGLDKLKEMAAARKDMAAAAGLDQDAAVAAGKEYSQQLREIQELAGVLKDVAAINLLPFFKPFAEEVKTTLRALTLIIGDWKNFQQEVAQSRGSKAIGKYTEKAWSTIDALTRGGVELSAGAAGRVGQLGPGWDADFKAKQKEIFGIRYKAGDDPAEFQQALENLFGIPSGVLERIWGMESGYGRHMLSPAGAMGHMGFMPKTAEMMGLSPQDTHDIFKSSAAAAKYFSYLYDKYKGNSQLALAAYNWGEGNVDKYGINSVITPRETLDYVSKGSGREVVFQQANEIKVYSSDPEAAGSAVGREQKRTGAELVRAAGAVR